MSGWRVPYPLRAARISLNLMPFGIWLKPSFTNYRRSEAGRREGELIWRARWLWFEISYSRWL